jgi:hypothetical protein
MQFSHIRNGTLAALALALAACAGNGAVPAGSANGMSPSYAAPLAKPTHPPKGSACATLANTWDFLGACKSQNLKPSGGVVQLKRYQGVAMNLAFHSTDAKGMVPFLFGDANGNGDITGTYGGNAFPAYGTSCVNLSAQAVPCTGTAFMYAEAVNTTQTTVNLTQTPRIVVTSQKGYPGATCALAVLQSSGAWLVTPVSGAAGKHALAIKSAAFPVALPPGGFYLAITCQ